MMPRYQPANDLPAPSASGVCDFDALAVPPRKASENPMDATKAMACPTCGLRLPPPRCPVCDAEERLGGAISVTGVEAHE